MTGRWGSRLAARLGLDPVELACLVVLAGVSLAVLLPLLTKGRPLSGADGLLAADQLQYFTWIRESAEHLLIGNRYDMEPGPRTFLHPGFALTGLVHRLTGVSIPLAYLLLWKPLAVGLLFAGALAYVRRLLPAGGRRRVALVLALFAVMPASAIVAWTDWGGNTRQYTFDFIAGELWTGQFVLGYFMTGIAVGLMPLVLLGYESWRDGGRRRNLVLASLGALLICWLQPWQGATLGLIVAGVEAWRFARTRERPPLGALAPLAGLALPTLYYLILSKADSAWRLAAEANAAGALPEWSWPWWAMVLTLAPLAVPAALAFRLPAQSWQERAVRLWPLAAIVVYLLPFGTFPYHSLQGMALPLAILAVQGVAALRPALRPATVAAALFVLVVPGLVHRLELAANSVHAAGSPYFVFGDEVRALDQIERDPRPGGVLAPTYAGHLLPSTTGREVWVGALSWTPQWRKRQQLADPFFEGAYSPERGRRFVLSTRARFVFKDCRPGLVDVSAALAPIAQSVHRYGCATVWVLKPRPGMDRPGPPDA